MFKKSLILVLTFLTLLPLSAVAADSQTSNPQGLTVSPPLKELTIKPGQSEKVKIKLTNPTSSVLEIYPSVVDFTSKDESGDPQFLMDEEKSPTYSLSSWVSFAQSKIALAEKQIVEWEYTISVPDNGGAGGHYGAIMFSNKPPSEQTSVNQVGIASMVASLVLVTVPGDIKENAYLSEFSTNKLYYSSLPVDITTKISNIGNTHVAPTGKLAIKSMFGTKVAEFQLNDEKGRILPEATRSFATSWKPSGGPFYKDPIGRYTVELTAIYGSDKKYSLNETIAFWVIPLWLIITIAVLLIVLITLLVYVHRKKKRKLAINS